MQSVDFSRSSGEYLPAFIGRMRLLDIINRKEDRAY